jgi:hypothetical protein
LKCIQKDSPAAEASGDKRKNVQRYFSSSPGDSFPSVTLAEQFPLRHFNANPLYF